MRAWMDEYTLVIKPRARQDLKRLWRYGFERWGVEQADSYTLNLGKGIHSLKDNPKLGFEINEVKEGYRQLRLLEHVLIYRVMDNAVEVVRVLGKRMDLSQHIK